LDFGHLILFSISDLVRQSTDRVWFSRDCHAFGSQWRIPYVIARHASAEAIPCPTEIATPSARNDGLVAISYQFSVFSYHLSAISYR